MLRRVFLSIALLAASACTAPTESSPIAGRWIGAISTVSVDLTMSESSGTVSGNGNLSGPGGAVAVTVSGTFANPTLSLSLASSGVAPTNYTGTLSGNVITGTLNGSGLVNLPLTLQRQ